MSESKTCEVDTDLAKQIGKQEILTEELENLKDDTSEIDREEAQSWLTTILKAIFGSLN